MIKKIPFLCLLLSSAAMAAVFWRRPAKSMPTWPTAMPAFAGGQTVFAVESGHGDAVVHQLTDGGVEAVLDAARGAYGTEGWTEAPIRTRDALLFTRGSDVAAVFAEDTPSGTRVTAVQRTHGN